MNMSKMRKSLPWSWLELSWSDYISVSNKFGIETFFALQLIDNDGNEITEPNIQGEFCIKSDYCIVKVLFNGNFPIRHLV